MVYQYVDCYNRLVQDLNTYHTDMNNLIASYNSEKIALEQDRIALEQERNKTLEDLRAKTHTVSGVIKLMGEALTGQLQSDLQSSADSLKANRYQYKFDTLAIGGLNNLINLVTDFQNSVEQQQSTFISFNTKIGILGNDVQDLISDMTDWQLSWQLVIDDWNDVAKALPPYVSTPEPSLWDKGSWDSNPKVYTQPF